MTDQSSAKRGRLRRIARHQEAIARGTHTREEWIFLKDYCGGRCVGCGAQFIRVRHSGEYQLPQDGQDPCEWGRFTKDHIRSLLSGGSDAIDNLQPMCRDCNSAKGIGELDLRPAGWREALDRALVEGWKRPPEVCVGCPPGCRECEE